MNNEILGCGKGQLEMASATGRNAFMADEMDYQHSVRIIGEEMQKTKQSFIKIGWYLKHIKDRKLYERDGYPNIYKFAEDKFHISQPTATRFMNLCIKFSAGSDSAELDKRYEGFTVSQLVEMLPLKPGQKEKVTPDMTVKQIREIKKEGKREPPKEMPEDVSDFLGQGRPGDTYATSHKGGTVKACPEKKSGEPGLPEFNNDAGCRGWLRDVEAWGLWYEDNHIHARYYKHDFPDGSRIIAVRYRDACPPCMPGPQGQRTGQVEDDGSYYGEPYYHMIYSESHLESHKGQQGNHCRNYTHEETPTEEIVVFLKELQGRKKHGDARKWRWVGFDTGRLEEEDNSGLPYLTRQYIKFYKRNGYIPKYFNVKNCTEVKDCAPTLATGCGSFGAIGSVAIFDLGGNIQRVLEDGTVSPDAWKEKVAGFLSIAGPEEREEALEGLGNIQTAGILEEAADAFEGKVRFKVTALTPGECFALMGIDSGVVERCRELGVSDTDLYKQAGNGIVTNCVQYLMEHLYKAQVEPSYICTDERMDPLDTAQEE